MKDWLDSIDARTKKQAKYDKEHTTQVCLKLNLRTDEDILKWLWKQSSKQGAIKELIRQEIARTENDQRVKGLLRHKPPLPFRGGLCRKSPLTQRTVDNT